MVALAAPCLLLYLSGFRTVFSLSDRDGQSSLKSEDNASDALEVFQVYKPIDFTPSGSGCKQDVLLMKHQFAYSYGHPFVGDYQPPQCDFDTVVINFTVTSEGRQFDRLALMYLGDVEVFRTSTAEPTSNGILWTYIKDMSQYTALWKQPQKLIFDLGNLIDSTYTGPYNTTLTASFSKQHIPKTSDIILPISAKKSASNGTSAFIIPDTQAIVSVTIPSDVTRAVVSISANGQINEEFWWSDVFDQDINTFNSTIGTLSGYSPFREVQLFIDGTLAGVVWPFPIIFTGGIAPSFWRPIVGIDAFDLRMSEIDITPFVPYLSDNKPHSFEIKVVGLDTHPDGTATLTNSVGYYWIVTGAIFLYQDGITYGMGPRPTIAAPDPIFATTRQLVQDPKTGANLSLSYSVIATRTFTTSSPHYTWSQTLSFSNYGVLSHQGFTQWNKQTTDGKLVANTFGIDNVPSTTFSYPLEVNTTYIPLSGGFTIDAQLDNGLQITSNGELPGVSTFTLVSGPCDLHTKQYGTAHLEVTSIGSSGYGETTQEFTETAGNSTYSRTVKAVNGSIASDSDALRSKGYSPLTQDGGGVVGLDLDSIGRFNVRRLLGRGPDQDIV